MNSTTLDPSFWPPWLRGRRRQWPLAAPLAAAAASSADTAPAPAPAPGIHGTPETPGTPGNPGNPGNPATPEAHQAQHASAAHAPGHAHPPAPQPLPIDLAGACCDAVGRIFALREISEDSWLRAASEALRHIEGDVDAAAAEIIVAEARDIQHRLWRVIHSAISRPDELDIDASSLADRIVQDERRWLIDASSALEPPRFFLRHDRVSDESWRTHSLRAARETFGLFDYARATMRLPGSVGPIAIIVQISGCSREWRPNERTRSALVAAAPLAAAAFARAFVEPAVRKKNLLEMLSGAQRSVAELMVSNVKESEIARRLDRSRHTIHDHVKAIHKAWGVGSRLEALLVWDGVRPAPREFAPPSAPTRDSVVAMLDGLDLDDHNDADGVIIGAGAGASAGAAAADPGASVQVFRQKAHRSAPGNEN